MQCNVTIYFFQLISFMKIESSFQNFILFFHNQLEDLFWVQLIHYFNSFLIYSANIWNAHMYQAQCYSFEKQK